MLIRLILSIGCLLLSSGLFYQYGAGLWHPFALQFMEKQTVADVIDKYGERTRQQLTPIFATQNIDYPPAKLALIAFKEEKRLQVWASNHSGPFRMIKQYPILAASGQAGPKLREGDRQVPEGLYNIVAYNPNSAYHLSLKLNYPNAFDQAKAKLEGRHEPGSNIFIHGRAVSIGCLALGDPAIEQLFSLVYHTQRRHVQVLIAPYDFSNKPLQAGADTPDWTSALYRDIESHYHAITQTSINH